LGKRGHMWRWGSEKCQNFVDVFYDGPLVAMSCIHSYIRRCAEQPHASFQPLTFKDYKSAVLCILKVSRSLKEYAVCALCSR